MSSINEENPKDAEAVSVGNWLLSIFISAIPLLNILMWLIWAMDRNTPKSKQNWAKAMLLSLLIGIAISALFFGALFTALFSFFSELNSVEMGV